MKQIDRDYKKWLWEKNAERCAENLRKHGFQAEIVPSPDAARQMALKIAEDCESIGFGGSDTVRSIGLVKAVRDQGKTVHDHWQEGLDEETELEIRLAMGRCDCFICSANAISATGEIVNVDGIGNRTNAMCFGPKKVVIVAGMNKVTPDLDTALRRVHEVAAPMRAKSLNMETPCAKTGFCTDCNAPQRICRITAILHRKPVLTDISVILVLAPLGF